MLGNCRLIKNIKTNRYAKYMCIREHMCWEEYMLAWTQVGDIICWWLYLWWCLRMIFIKLNDHICCEFISSSCIYSWCVIMVCNKHDVYGGKVYVWITNHLMFLEWVTLPVWEHCMNLMMLRRILFILG